MPPSRVSNREVTPSPPPSKISTRLDNSSFKNQQQFPPAHSSSRPKSPTYKQPPPRVSPVPTHGRKMTCSKYFSRRRKNWSAGGSAIPHQRGGIISPNCPAIPPHICIHRRSFSTILRPPPSTRSSKPA